jgi:hypothetical protein
VLGAIGMYLVRTLARIDIPEIRQQTKDNSQRRGD